MPSLNDDGTNDDDNDDGKLNALSVRKALCKYNVLLLLLLLLCEPFALKKIQITQVACCFF